MITLRDLVRTDGAIAGITGEECHFIASVLTFVWFLDKKWYLRWLIPKKIRNEAFRMKMIAAVLGRTAKEREPSLNEQIRVAMEQDRKMVQQ
jgi:hypothetical protein